MILQPQVQTGSKGQIAEFKQVSNLGFVTQQKKSTCDKKKELKELIRSRILLLCKKGRKKMDSVNKRRARTSCLQKGKDLRPASAKRQRKSRLGNQERGGQIKRSANHI